MNPLIRNFRDNAYGMLLVNWTKQVNRLAQLVWAGVRALTAFFFK